MLFTEMLDKACDMCGGSKSELGRVIGVSGDGSNMRAAWNGRPIPERSLYQLSVMLRVPFGEVVRAHNAHTAKNEEDRRFWASIGRAAMIGGISMGVVTTYVTPSPAEAAPVHKDVSGHCVLCKT